LQKLVAKMWECFGICQSLKKFALGWMNVERDFYLCQLVQFGSLTKHVFHLGVRGCLSGSGADKNCCVRVWLFLPDSITIWY
jgi:hypothetical protein